jgi:capsular polysaccharide biosynthesis protein
LDRRTLVHALRRHKAIFGVLFALGLLAGAAVAFAFPPLLASKVLVVVPASRDISTQAVIADSDPVLVTAGRNLRPALPLETIRHRVTVTSVTSTILQITAQGKTAAQAQDTANAVAKSYVAFVQSPGNPGGRTSAQVLESATPATGTTLVARSLETAGLGALVGALLGVIVAVAIGRTDRRLRERDEIAAAIGASVLASYPVGHPTDGTGWAQLLESYEPGVVHAWNMRKALRHLGLTDARSANGTSVSLAVVSLSSDRRALALGPQLAVFAASLGIPTTLIVGPQEDPNFTSALYAACTMMATVPGKPNRLRFAIGDNERLDRNQTTAFKVMLEVVNSRTPRVSYATRATATVLGVSAGSATAEQLARVALSVAGRGKDIAGILVADPLPTDRTTGSLPQLGQPRRKGPAQHRQSARLGATQENQQ